MPGVLGVVAISPGTNFRQARIKSTFSAEWQNPHANAAKILDESARVPVLWL